MTLGLHPRSQQFESAPTHFSNAKFECIPMTNDLLHLIRDAEKKAGQIIKEATLEAQKIIEEARSEAKQILIQATTIKLDTETEKLKKIRNKYQTEVEELEAQAKKRIKELEEQASKSMEEAVEFVVQSILEG